MDPIELEEREGFENYISLIDEVERKEELDEDEKMKEAAVLATQGYRGDQLFTLSEKGRLSKFSYATLRLPVYYLFILFAAMLLMLLSLVEEPSVVDFRAIYESSNCSDVVKPTVRLATGGVELFLLTIMLLDIILQLLYIGPQNIMSNKILLLNSVALVLLYVDAIVAMARHEDSYPRVIRALRPLFLIENWLMKTVHNVIKQVFESLKAISDVLVLLFFVVAVFAIFGFYFFAGVDYHYFSSYGQSFVSMFVLLTTANFPDVMMESYKEIPAAPIFFIVFLSISLYLLANVLLSVVYSNFQSNDKQRFKKSFLHERRALRVAYKILDKDGGGVKLEDFYKFMAYFQPQMSTWQVLCVYKAMKDRGNKLTGQQDDDLSPLKLQQFYTLFDFVDLFWMNVDESGKQLPWYTKINVTCCIRFVKVVNGLVNWQWFNPIISLIIVANTLINVGIYLFYLDNLGYVSEDNNMRNVTHLEAIQSPVLTGISIFFVVVYVLEILLRIIGNGPSYFKTFWNWFDFIIVGISFLAVLLEISPALKFAVFFRPLRLIRLLRLKQRYRDLLNSVGILIPQITSVIILVIVIFYFFAIIGMEAFEGFVKPGCCEDAWFFAGGYFSGARNETVPNIYWLNNFDNILRSYVTLFELMVVNNWFVLMEGFASQGVSPLIRLYFISFYIIALIATVVIVSYIVEAFSFKIDLADARVKHLRYCRRNHKGDDCTCAIEYDDNLKVVQVILTDTFVEGGLARCYDRPNVFGIRALQRHIRSYAFPWDDIQKDTELIYHGIRLWTQRDLYNLIHEKEIDAWMREHEWSENAAADSPHEKLTSQICEKIEDAMEYIFE